MLSLEDVHKGEGDWLFLTGGNNSPLGMFRADDQRRTNAIAAWKAALINRINILKAMDVSYVHIIVPEKISVYQEKLHLELPGVVGLGEGLISALNSPEKNYVPNLFSYFRSSPALERLYYRTDSHWTWVGAFQAMQMILHVLQCPLTQEQYVELKGRPKQIIDFRGDLTGAYSNISERAERMQFNRDSSVVDENGIIKLKRLRNAENDVGLHVGSSLRLVNSNPLVDKKIVLFGDSFSECRDGLLTFLLGEIFSSTTFVWSTSIDQDLIAKMKPDIVITEMTERFIWLPPDDNFNLDRFVRKRLEKFA